MPKINSETMTVRLPKHVANELVKLRDQKDLPTIGSALQFWVQQMKEDSLQKQIDSIAKNLAALVKRDTKRDRLLNVTCGVIHFILGAKSPWSKKFRKEMGCEDLERCFGKDWPGALFKPKAGTEEHVT